MLVAEGQPGNTGPWNKRSLPCEDLILFDCATACSLASVEISHFCVGQISRGFGFKSLMVIFDEICLTLTCSCGELGFFYQLSRERNFSERSVQKLRRCRNYDGCYDFYRFITETNRDYSQVLVRFL